METLFKKYFWVLNLVALGFAGYMVASTSNDYITGRLMAVPSTVLTSPDDGALDAIFLRKDIEGYAALLKARRPFNSDPLPEPEKPKETPTEDDNPADTGEEGVLEESELDAQLIGTMVAPDPGLSMATLILAGSSRLVRHGSDLDGKARVVLINRRNVLVDEGGKIRVIRLWSDKKASKKGRSPNVARAKVPDRENSRAKKKKKYSEGVTKTGDSEYSISRAMLDEQLQDLSQLGMEARIVPNYRNGKYEGFKLVGVRPNSLYRAIGIRSGDIVKRINGVEINSPNKAIELFEQFRSASNVSLDLERRGQVKTMSYDIK